MSARSDRVTEVCVVGAGAAGLWAAAVAARQGARVLVLEKTSDVGSVPTAGGQVRFRLRLTGFNYGVLTSVEIYDR